MSRENRVGTWEPPFEPELEDLFRSWARRLRLSIRTCVPGTVLSYDAATQTARVRVDFLVVRKVLDQPHPPPGDPTQDVNLFGTDADVSPPIIIPDAPVWIAGTGTGHLSFPILPGTTGMLHVMDRGLQMWRQSLKDEAVDPIQAATHMLGDGVFVPGLRRNKDAISPPADQTATVLHDDNTVKLGSALATLGVARLTDKTVPDASMTTWEVQVTAALVTIAGILNAPPAPLASAPGSVPVFPATTPSDLGVINTSSAKVKAE